MHNRLWWRGFHVRWRTDDGRTEGWVAKRWNGAVRERFASLLAALGAEFDGRIAGINLQESAIGVSEEYDPSFTPRGYVDGLRANMSALALMHEGRYSVPLGIAVQDGNYIGQTNSDLVVADRENIVPLLHAFARDFLGVSFIFRSRQESYFSEDLLVCVAPR